MQASQLLDISVEITVLEVKRVTCKMPTRLILLGVLEQALQGTPDSPEMATIVPIVRDLLVPREDRLEGEAFKTINQFWMICAYHHPVPFPVRVRGPFISSICYHCEAVIAALCHYGCKLREWPGSDTDLEPLQAIYQVRILPFSLYY